MYFWLMAAIFDLRHTQSSDSIPTSLSVQPDPENMAIAVGIPSLSCIYELRYSLLPKFFRVMRVMNAIFDLRHTQTSDSILM